jgi:predicted TIM-barrel fold metal-dependent hydrolase
MSAAALQGAIDCDVHVAPASIDALTPYMDDYWRDYLANAGLMLSPNLSGSYPPSAPATPGDVDALREQVPDPWGLRHAVLTCLTAFDASRNGYYEAALCSAINDWLRAEWLERDERLRAYLTIPTLDPDAAVKEIERVGSEPGFVGVLVPVRGETRWGNRRFHELHEAIAGHDLVLALHAWGRAGSAPTATGFTHTYFEDYLGNSQLVVQAQVLSPGRSTMCARIVCAAGIQALSMRTLCEPLPRMPSTPCQSSRRSNFSPGMTNISPGSVGSLGSSSVWPMKCVE